jgi:hypothetical protein
MAADGSAAAGTLECHGDHDSLLVYTLLAPTVELIAHLKAVGWGRRSTLWSLSKKLLEFLDDGMLSCQDFPGAVTTAWQLFIRRCSCGAVTNIGEKYSIMHCAEGFSKQISLSRDEFSGPPSSVTRYRVAPSLL